MNEKDLPLLLKLEKAKNEVRQSLCEISERYQLPGYVVDLVLEAVSSEEKTSRIALMTDQISAVGNVDEEVCDGRCSTADNAH